MDNVHAVHGTGLNLDPYPDAYNSFRLENSMNRLQLITDLNQQCYQFLCLDLFPTDTFTFFPPLLVGPDSPEGPNSLPEAYV